MAWVATPSWQRISHPALVCSMGHAELDGEAERKVFPAALPRPTVGPAPFPDHLGEGGV